jgi:hypothetical protein
MSEPHSASLLSTPVRHGGTAAGEDFSRRAGAGSTPGSRYLSTHISSRSGVRAAVPATHGFAALTLSV